MAEKKNVPSLWTANPFGEFRKEMDQLVEDFFGKGSMLSRSGLSMPSLAADKELSFVNPAIDIKENGKAIVLTAELPGLADEDVDISVHDGVLTLKGEKKFEKEEKDEKGHVQERRYGSFQRSMSLPDRVDEAKISAKFEKGVLTVTMPKRPDAKPSGRKIAIGK
jgi:HSP20 family protein